MRDQRRVVSLAVLCVVQIITGCAGVNFYSDPELTKKTGIPIYSPKPYLMVARTGAKDKPVEISIVHLADPQKVVYADPRSGFGSSNLQLGLTNGVLTTFGQQTDAKVTELISALGGFITARATASKTEAEAAQIRYGMTSTEQAAISPVAAGTDIKKRADDLVKDADQLPGLIPAERNDIKKAAAAISEQASALQKPANSPNASKYYEQIKTQLDTLTKIVGSLGPGTSRDNTIQTLLAHINGINAKLVEAQPENAPPPTFELYEIIQGPAGPSLRLVKP